MKNKLLFLTLFLQLSVLAMAQKENTIQLYGFFQPVLPGIAPARDIDESGQVIKKNPVNTAGNYFIYATIPGSIKMYPVTIWIKGKAYAVKASAVTKLPAVISDHTAPGKAEKISLPAQTGKKVMQLTPAPVSDNKVSSQSKRLSLDNELVVAYKRKGKLYSAVLEKFTVLHPQAMQ